MSEYEDRQDAAPAIVAPAAETPAPILAETADLEAVAAVEGTTDADTVDIVDNAAEGGAPDTAPDISIAATPATPASVVAVTDVEVIASSDVADDTDEDDSPLLDDALEEGIASVFAALQAAAGNGEIGESDEPFGPLSDAEAVDGITFRLLGELDRLWHRAA